MDFNKERPDETRERVTRLTDEIASAHDSETRTDLLLERAMCFETHGDSRAAASDYLDAMELTTDKKKQSHACFMLSCMFAKKGEKESALWWANEVLDRDASSPEGLFAAGVALAVGQLHRRAIEQFKAVTALVKDHVQARLELGRCYREVAAIEEAIHVFEELSKQFSDDALYHYELGWTHHVNIRDLDRIPKALHHYDMALSLSPPSNLSERIHRKRKELAQ